MDQKLSGSVAFSANYNSNVAGGDNLVAAVKGLRPSDILYQPSAQLNLVLPIGPLGVFLTGSAGYDFYQYNKDLQAERVNLVGGFQGQLGPCQGGVTGGYSVHQSNQADLPIETTVNRQTVVSYGAQVSCNEGRAIGENLSIQHAQSTNSATRGVVDSETTGVNGGLSYNNKLVGALSLFAGFSKVDYSSPDTLIPAPPGFRSYDLGVSLSRPIGQRLNGTASLSYNEVHSEVPGVSDYSTWAGHGSLNYRVNQRLQATLSYDRSAVPSLQQGFGYSILQSFQLDGTYQLTRKLSATLGVGRFDQNYRGATIVLPGQITEDERNQIFGGLSLTLPRHISLSINAGYSVRNTNLTIFEYKDTRVGVTASKAF
jgi:putative beta-barrel porin BBP2